MDRNEEQALNGPILEQNGEAEDEKEASKEDRDQKNKLRNAGLKSQQLENIKETEDEQQLEN